MGRRGELALELYTRSLSCFSRGLGLSERQSLSKVDPLAGTKQVYDKVIIALEEQLHWEDKVLIELETAKARPGEENKELRREIARLKGAGENGSK